jgi:hypothetical protein
MRTSRTPQVLAGLVSKVGRVTSRSLVPLKEIARLLMQLFPEAVKIMPKGIS